VGCINQRTLQIGFGLFLALAFAIILLGQSRAQMLGEPPILRLLPAQPPTDAPAFVPGVVLVRLAESDRRTTDAVQRLGVDFAALTPLSIPSETGLYRLAVPNGDEKATAARLSARPDVLFAEPDFLFFAAETTPNDPHYAPYQWNLRQIRANAGWDRTTGSNSVVIAVVDTGVDLGHPDLAGKIVGGIDTVNNDADAQDDQGHGTHVASIAAAQSNNGTGVAGVDWNARIMPVKVLDAQGSGSASGVAMGIVWAADNGADIINLSLSGTNPSTVIENAVQYAHAKGVLVVAAAGNAYNQGNPTSYPAAYPSVLAVAAVNDSDGHASYSNSGAYVDVAAPGGDPSDPNDNNSRHWIAGAYWRGSGMSYAWLSGTSQAAPQVAGLAALLLAVNPTLTPDQITQFIASSAADVQTSGWDIFSGFGRIDVAAALAMIPPPATATPTSTPTETPTITPTFTPSATPTPTPPARSRADMRVNSVATNAQFHPALAIDSADNLAVVWRDGRSGADALYSAGQAADATQWSANLILSGSQQLSTTEEIGLPGLAAGPGKSFVAAWRDEQPDGGANDIFVSGLDWDRSVWSGPVLVRAGLSITQSSPAIVMSADGVIVTVWEETAPPAPSQIYWSQSTGNGEWSDALPVAPSANAQRTPRLAVGGETAYVVWVEQVGKNPWILLAQRALTSAQWTTPALVIVAANGGHTGAPDIVADSSGNLLAVWQEDRGEATGLDIYAAWRSPGGGWSAAQRVGSDPGGAEQSAPRLAANGREATLVWQDERSGDGDIYVAWTAWPGGAWPTARRVNQDTDSAEQFAPDVALDSRGNTTIVWSDERAAPSNPDVYSRFIPAGERFKFYLPVVKK
jgi:subtilisin family serine protease